MIRLWTMLFHKEVSNRVIRCHPISFYFVLREQAAKKLEGFSIAHGAPNVTHLFFANGSLLFCKANTTLCYTI